MLISYVKLDHTLYQIRYGIIDIIDYVTRIGNSPHQGQIYDF